MKNKPASIAIILLLLFFSSSIWLVFEYVANERARDMSDWQARLNIMAESQQSSIDGWFDKQAVNITALANNPLLQIYVSELSSGGKSEGSDTRRGQIHHLKNLINATADHAKVFTPINKISSNVQNVVNDGIAVISADGAHLATRNFPVDDDAVAEAFRQVMVRKTLYISDIYAARSNTEQTEEQGRQPRLIIAAPVTSVQTMRPDDIKAAVVAVINPEHNLYKLLLKEWVTTRSDESLLVSKKDGQVSYLSPLKNGFTLFHSQPVTDSAAAKIIASAGSLVTDKDYRRQDVLATARVLHNTSMVLIQKIDVSEALSESRAHQNFILIVFILVVFIVTISYIAIWKHASSLRLQKATRRLKARAELLNAVGDSINDHIFLLDHDNKLVFINDALAKTFSVDVVDIRGKALNHIFNSEITGRLLDIKPASGAKNVRNIEMRLEIDNSLDGLRRRDYHVSVVALSHPDYLRSYLFVMHDITALKDAQGRHNRLMDAIIATLANVIDKHDPHCVSHSERTREVAVAIARAMDLSQERIDALSMAALLANVGKLYIPAEVLTNVEALTQDEESCLRENINHSVDILKDLEFDGRVIDFVQQKSECLDGSGYPNGLSGDEIFQESRVLSVANAFVAMTSSRAYRSGKPIKEVLEVLMAETGTRFDRQVVAALFHIVENHADWVNWQRVQ